MSQVDIIGVQHYTPGIGHPKTSTNSGGSVVAVNESNETVLAGGKKTGRIRRDCIKLVTVGDSFIGYSNLMISVSSITASNGVITATFASSHNAYTGSKISVVGAADMAANVHQVPIVVNSSISISFPAPNVPNGTVANDGSTIQIIFLCQQIDNGVACWIQRMTLGAFDVVSNAGCPGRTSTEILRYWEQRVTDFRPDAIYWECGYNNVNRGVSVSQSIDDVREAIELSSGIPFYISSAWPFGSAAAANTAANIQWLATYNKRLEALCSEYANVVFIDNYGSLVDPATGLIGSANYLFADAIHPSPQGRKIAVQNLLNAMQGQYKARAFQSSGVDNVSVSADSVNIARFMPRNATTGGGAGSGVTSAVPSTDGSTGSAAAGTAGVAAGFTVSGTQVSAASAWIKTGTDGYLYQAAQYTAFTGTAGNARISLALTNADVTPGGVVNLSFKGSASTQHAASNKSLGGQGVTSVTAQLVITNADGTFTIQEARSAESVASRMPTGDIVDFAFVIDGLIIPVGASISLARVDLIANTSLTTSNVQLEMGRVAVNRA